MSRIVWGTERAFFRCGRYCHLAGVTLWLTFSRSNTSIKIRTARLSTFDQGVHRVNKYIKHLNILIKILIYYY